MKALERAHKDSWYKYEEQQQQIKEIQWMKKNTRPTKTRSRKKST